jgi:hypothetical protein
MGLNRVAARRIGKQMASCESGGEEIVSLIPSRIDSATLAVSDVHSSALFYRDTLGFRQIYESKEIIRFQLENIKLSLVDKGVLLDETHLDSLPAAPGPVTLAISVPREEVDEYMTRLERASVTVIAPAEDKPLGARIGFVADPDGHMWEIISTT